MVGLIINSRLSVIDLYVSVFIKVHDCILKQGLCTMATSNNTKAALVAGMLHNSFIAVSSMLSDYIIVTHATQIQAF